MASDLPPYLTHASGRNIPWKGHASFPRKVVHTHAKRYYPWIGDLRIFKMTMDGYGQIVYVLMHDDDIEKYMHDPTYVG